jgi:hypothetical protein
MSNIEESGEETVKWFKKAAEQEEYFAEPAFLDSYYDLGCIYERGRIVKRNLRGAAKWYRKADSDICRAGAALLGKKGIFEVQTEKIQVYMSRQFTNSTPDRRIPVGPS